MADWREHHHGNVDRELLPDQPPSWLSRILVWVGFLGCLLLFMWALVKLGQP